jgi:DnaJ-domain-containing protein 1
MPRRLRPAPDPVVRRKVVEAIHRDRERDNETASEVAAWWESLEWGLQQARHDQPNHRPIERELLLAWVSRIKRYNFPLLSPEVNSASDLSVAARDKYWSERLKEREQIWAEIWELAGFLWGQQQLPRLREVSGNIWNDDFLKDLRERGVPPGDALEAVKSLIPTTRGRRITKRQLAVKALQMKKTKGWSWPRVYREVCDCGQPTHGSVCQVRLKSAVKIVKHALDKYGIKTPTGPA